MSLPSHDNRRDESAAEEAKGSEAQTGRRLTGLAAAGITPAPKRKETPGEGGEGHPKGAKGEAEGGAVASAGSKNKKDSKKNPRKGSRKSREPKKSFEDMTAAERREAKEQKKRKRILAGAVTGGLTVVAASIFVLTVDLGGIFDDEAAGGDALEDDQRGTGGRGALEDDAASEASDAPSDEGFPTDLDLYLREGYNSVENQQALNSWEDEYLDLDSWEELETDDGVISFEDWDVEANSPTDERRELSPGDEGYEEAQGWIYRDNAESAYRSGYIGDISQNWPSRGMGYTNNPELEQLEDGSLNPWYSYVVAEDVQWFFGHNLQRLLNPVYGGWFYWHEAPEEIGLTNFRELFTADWWDENIENGDVSNLPIYADWDNNNYGLDNEVGTYGWFGEVTDAEVEITEGEDGLSVIDATLYIEYSALSGGDTISRDAQLDIQVIPNTEDTEDINNRMLISSAQLSVGE